MPADEFHVRVVWRDGRAVPVDINVEEAVDSYEYAAPRPQRHRGIGLEDLENRQALHRFFEDTTRAESGDRPVEAVCMSFRVPRLLELLDVAHPIPNPIVVELDR
jgi:hypothetical protein